MIVSFLFYLAGFVIGMIFSVFGVLNWSLPSLVPNALKYFVDKSFYLNGIFPIADIWTAIVVITAVWVAYYIVKLVLWVIKFIPIIGHASETITPTHKITSSVSVSRPLGGGVYKSARLSSTKPVKK